MLVQRTLKRAVIFQGIAMHSGKSVVAKVKPAPENTGVIFIKKTDKNTVISAIYKNVVSTNMATTLGSEGETLSTVEHLLAAFYGLGVDNAIVEVDGDEIPILDGSAMPFVKKLVKAGFKNQNALRNFIYIKEPIRVTDGYGVSELLPSSNFEISCKIDFKHPSIGGQEINLRVNDATFIEELCHARTFGFYKDIRKLHAAGLAKGGSCDNAVVLNDDKVINLEGLRCSDEFVRHKALDCLGDVFLLGARLMGRLRVEKSGHTLHHALIAKLAEETHKWSFVRGEQIAFDLEDIAQVHLPSLRPRLSLARTAG